MLLPTPALCALCKDPMANGKAWIITQDPGACHLSCYQAVVDATFINDEEVDKWSAVQLHEKGVG